jgi:phage terminase small subunit
MKKRSPKERLFVHEYLIVLNGTQAAIRAGYERTHAKFTACRLMKKPEIKKAIEAAMKRRENKAIMTREEILEELTICGRVDPDQFYKSEDGGEQVVKTFEEMGPARRAIAEIKEDRIIKEVSGDDKKPDTTMVLSDKRTIRFHDKLKALELLGKHEGLFPTKVEGNLRLTGKLSVNAMKKSLKDLDDGSDD